MFSYVEDSITYHDEKLQQCSNNAKTVLVCIYLTVFTDYRNYNLIASGFKKICFALIAKIVVYKQ